MFKSGVQAAVAALVVALGAAGAAQAGPSIVAGNFKISLDNYDSGTTGYGSALGQVCGNLGGTLAADIADCDGKATSKAVGSISSVNGSADTMGIFSISKIVRISDNTTWYTIGQGGLYLTGVFGNLVDYNVSNTSGGGAVVNTTAKAVGGTFAIYENAADYSPAVGAAVSAGVVDLNLPKYTGITGGSVWLSGVFGAGAIAGDTTTTYKTTYDNVSLAGAGQAFLDVTGGSAMASFDTNGQIGLNGEVHDLFLSTIFDAADDNDTANGWTVTSVGQIKGAAVPEPGSVALVGLGLLAAACSARRRKA